jgi:class 3 adenylate cyclase
VGDRALPTGTVTFLMTDIEGSTRLWQDHPSLMNDVIERHDRLIETAVTAHRGVFVKWKGEGDSTFSVFTRPSDRRCD